jgi:hypothetical protein
MMTALKKLKTPFQNQKSHKIEDYKRKIKKLRSESVSPSNQAGFLSGKMYTKNIHENNLYISAITFHRSQLFWPMCADRQWNEHNWQHGCNRHS